jgi:hypothetical protein
VITDWNGSNYLLDSHARSRLQREAESWSPPCTLSAEELRSTEPSDETLRRMEAHADWMNQQQKEQQQRNRLGSIGAWRRTI